ncbi:MAG: hypothetical protein ACRDN6_03590, partial [Gaiellaceae bacterium]
GLNPAADPAAVVFTRDNLLLPDPAGTGRPALLPGESFVETGAFRITVFERAAGSAGLRFAWTDATAPRAPRIFEPESRVPRGGTLPVEWHESRERGSGVAFYEVSLDGRRPVRVPVDFRVSATASFRTPAPGPHRVSVTAVDRAGNRSASAVRRFTVARARR